MCMHVYDNYVSKAVQATRSRGASNYIAIATRNENMGLATSGSKLFIIILRLLGAHMKSMVSLLLLGQYSFGLSVIKCA